MNGSQLLLKALVEAGIEICFANPGTSEMHLVLAIGKSDAVRPILCLFEGVATGAADGYGRMADKPAITLLHMGPGFSNGMANLHNAHKAHVPVVNIVGNHATYHLKYDTPLSSDVPAHARICSDWVHASDSAEDLATIRNAGGSGIHGRLGQSRHIDRTRQSCLGRSVRGAITGVAISPDNESVGDGR